MSAKKEEDKRIIKTKKNLRESLLSLMTEIPFDKITVNALCEKAVINRMTFYKHYKDKYDLFGDVMDETKDAVIKRSVARNGGAVNRNNHVEFCVNLFNAVIEECDNRRDVLQNLIMDENTIMPGLLGDKIRRYVNELTEELSRHKRIKYPAEYVSSFICGGMSSLIFTYITDKSPSKSQIKKSIENFARDLLEKDLLFEKIN